MMSMHAPDPTPTAGAFPASKVLMLARLAKFRPHALAATLFASIALTAPHPLSAQASDPRAQQAIEAAVQAELAAAHSDHSNWMYHDRDTSPTHATYSYQIETPQGSLKRILQSNGVPLTGEARDNETNRIAHIVNDAAIQSRERKAGAHDDAQAEEMTKMLPHAFLWTVASETPEYLTLNYRPNPAFNPPDYESRVMCLMAGQVIIARQGHRMRTLRGTLTEDVKFGFGLFGRMNKGGTFDVERRMVGDGHWQITESHVHIGGHALLFKEIGQQDDEVKTDWKPSPAQTLHDAEDLLRDIR